MLSLQRRDASLAASRTGFLSGGEGQSSMGSGCPRLPLDVLHGKGPLDCIQPSKAHCFVHVLFPKT